MRFKQPVTIFLLQNGALAVNLGTQFILTALLPLSVFGSFAKVFVVRDILLPFLSFSLGMSVIYNPTEDRKALAATSAFLSIIQVLIIFIGGSIVCYILFLTGYFNSNDFVLILCLLGISGFNVFYLTFFSLFEREGKFIFNSSVNLVIAVISSAAVLITAYFSRTIFPLLLRELLPIFLLAVFYVTLVFKTFGIRSFVKQNINKEVMKGMIDYSLKMYLSRSVEALFYKIDLLIVSRLFPSSTIGLYERARYFASLGWTTIVNYINRIHFVKYIKAGDLSLFRKTNRYAVLLNIGLFLLSGIIIFILSKYSDKVVWEQILLLMPFLGAYAVGSIVENYKTLFYAKGEVIYAMTTLRIIPLAVFTIPFLLAYFFYDIDLRIIGLISSFAYLSSLIVIKIIPPPNIHLRNVE